jgi:DNA-binding HxlR family transcriptional regulator
VLKSLVDGPKRYSEVSHDLAGVSQKMLTQTLRNLERDGLVIRTVTPSVPVRVDYALTLLGESLQGVLGQLKTGRSNTCPTSTGLVPATTRGADRREVAEPLAAVVQGAAPAVADRLPPSTY